MIENKLYVKNPKLRNSLIFQVLQDPLQRESVWLTLYIWVLCPKLTLCHWSQPFDLNCSAKPPHCQFPNPLHQLNYKDVRKDSVRILVKVKNKQHPLLSPRPSHQTSHRKRLSCWSGYDFSFIKPRWLTLLQQSETQHSGYNLLQKQKYEMSRVQE